MFNHKNQIAAKLLLSYNVDKYFEDCYVFPSGARIYVNDQRIIKRKNLIKMIKKVRYKRAKVCPIRKGEKIKEGSILLKLEKNRVEF